jgi:hypothetical protein
MHEEERRLRDTTERFDIGARSDPTRRDIAISS